jgi:hypothetical protein
VVKVFPASAMGGAKYLTALKGPLPQIEMIPTGGVMLGTAAEFLEAGAFALGVGSDLVAVKAIADGRPEVVTDIAKKYMEIVREFRAKTKKYFKKWHVFRLQKCVVNRPCFTTRFTTNSPRITISLHHKNPKTPCKSHFSSPTKKCQGFGRVTQSSG